MAVRTRLLKLKPLSPSSPSSSLLRSFSALNSETDLRFPANSLPQLTKSKGRSVQWVFLGCPGVGKGTYASRLSQLLGVPHIATGDLVRHQLSSSSPISNQFAEIVNQGQLVSDEIVIRLLSERLEHGEAKGESGFILDGFPRTIRQAEIFEGVISIDLVVNLKLREDALIEKCLGRRICSECGGNFNVASVNIEGENGQPGIYMPPLLPPAHCASKLAVRSDDTEAVVKERLRVYYEMPMHLKVRLRVHFDLENIFHLGTKQQHGTCPVVMCIWKESKPPKFYKSQPVEEFYRSRGKLLEFDLPGGIPESWPKLLQVLNLEDHDDKQSAAA